MSARLVGTRAYLETMDFSPFTTLYGTRYNDRVPSCRQVWPSETRRGIVASAVTCGADGKWHHQPKRTRPVPATRRNPYDWKCSEISQGMVVTPGVGGPRRCLAGRRNRLALSLERTGEHSDWRRH